MPNFLERCARTRPALIVAAVAESATGLALLIDPSLAGRLLLGVQLAGPAVQVARVAGLALVGLGIACWPGPPRTGMLAYGGSVTLYLAYLGIIEGLSGPLLWPAVAAHALLSAVLAYEAKASAFGRPE